MSIFSFKKKVKVYAVYADIQHRLDVSNINFGQTFTDNSYSNKSLQIENMFEQSVINKANPATFELTFPAIREGDLKVLFDRALDYASFDLYVETKQNVFKIEKCVISSAVFGLNKMRPLHMDLNGEASKVTRLGARGDVVIPGTIQSRSATRTYNKVSYLSILLNGVMFSERVSTLTVDLQNEIKWVPYTTTNDAIAAINAGTSMYPDEYVLNKRVLSGTIVTYDIPTISTTLANTLHIEVGQKVGVDLYGFNIDINNAVFTNRLNTGETFTKHYTWRMIENPDALSQIISYLTELAGDSATILDSWNIPVLDSSGNPLLESP